VVVGSAPPTMDALQMKKGIDGGAGSVIAKSFSAIPANSEGSSTTRFKLFDYRDYPGYPDKLPTPSPSGLSKSVQPSITRSI